MKPKLLIPKIPSKSFLQIFVSISNRHLIGVLCMVGRNGGDIELWDFLQKCLVKGSLCIYLVVSYWASLFKNVNFKSEIKLNKASYSPGLEKRKKERRGSESLVPGVFFTCTLRSVINSQSLFYSTQRSTIEVQSHTFMVAFGGRGGLIENPVAQMIFWQLCKKGLMLDL